MKIYRKIEERGTRMQIKRIYNRNIGPTEIVNIEFCKNENNTPKPVILVGENGAGKSTVLSNIVDAFYEMAGIAYSNVREKDGEGYQYYKAIMRSEINIGHKFMVSFIEFWEPNQEQIISQYVFKSGQLTYKEFCNEIGVQLKNTNIWNDEKDIKGVSVSQKDVERIFSEEIFCYFGPDRYEKPQWMGKKYYMNNQEDYSHITIKPKYNGKLFTPITVKDVTEETLRWLLDVIVDSRTDIIAIDNIRLEAVHADINDVLALGIARDNIEKIMSAILGKDIFFGLNFRSAHGSRFNILDKQSNNIIIPTLDALSTGQSALFNMFATIVRYADSNNINKSIKLDEIEGIVVIDEIELHLHSKLQREVLPKLLKLFPNVQFVITTHSPLFLLGMDEQYGKDGYCIYQMPRAELISSECFTEFQNAYTYMYNTETFQLEIKNAIQSKTQKTLIVTEGATDWRHLKAALISFSNKEQENNFDDLNIEFLEYNPKNSNRTELIKLDMSCSNLVTMCKEFAKVPQPRKIIFIADADDKETIRQLSDKSNEYKSWGNNVYSMILPVPQHRQNTPNICIEHYYSDDDLKTPLKINGIARRIYMGQEFDEVGLSNDRKYMCIDRNSCGEGKICIIDGQSEKRVFRIDDSDKKNLALPKMDFAEAIYTQKEEMKNIDFSEFSLIFSIIKIIDEIKI